VKNANYSCFHLSPTPFPVICYLALGRTAALRREAYSSLFKGYLDEDDIKEIRAAWQTGTRLGNDHFKVKLEAKLKTKVGQSRRGRPSKRAFVP